MKIKTKLGYINARDAIHLDVVKYYIETLELVFEGEINSSSCSIKQIEKWIKYKFSFESVNSYKCIPVDDFNENLTESSFDIILNENEKSESNKYILSTYDHIFEILAKDYILETYID